MTDALFRAASPGGDSTSERPPARPLRHRRHAPVRGTGRPRFDPDGPRDGLRLAGHLRAPESREVRLLGQDRSPDRPGARARRHRPRAVRRRDRLGAAALPRGARARAGPRDRRSEARHLGAARATRRGTEGDARAADRQSRARRAAEAGPARISTATFRSEPSGAIPPTATSSRGSRWTAPSRTPAGGSRASPS